MSWANTVSTKANGLIVRFHGRARAIRGFTSYQRWLRENPEICLDLDVFQTGTTYDMSVRLRTSKKALGHNLVRFQEYNGFLRRKTGGRVNVDALAAFIAILIMTKIPASVGRQAGKPEHKAGKPEHKAGKPEHEAGKPEHKAGKPEHKAGKPGHEAVNTTSDVGEEWKLGEGTGLESWEDGNW